MKEVFAISHGSYSDYSVLAIAPDEQTADAWVKAMQADHESYDQPRVERMVLLDAGQEPYKTTTYQRVAQLWDDGTISQEQSWSTTQWAINTYFGIPPKRPAVRYVRAPIHENKGGRLEVRGDSAEAVAKAFGEKVAMWKAGAFGGPRCQEINESVQIGDAP